MNLQRGHQHSDHSTSIVFCTAAINCVDINGIMGFPAQISTWKTNPCKKQLKESILFIHLKNIYCTSTSCQHVLDTEKSSFSITGNKQTTKINEAIQTMLRFMKKIQVGEGRVLAARESAFYTA